MDEEHVCSQEGVLAKICEKLENIEKQVTDIKDDQKCILDQFHQQQLRDAQYPPADEVRKIIKKVENHETVLGIMIAGLALAATWVSGVLQKIFLGGG